MLVERGNNVKLDLIQTETELYYNTRTVYYKEVICFRRKTKVSCKVKKGALAT